MIGDSPAPSEAVIICTRNRPSDLRSTLHSVADQRGHPRRVLVVDASNPSVQAENQETLDEIKAPYWTHHPYNELPSSGRQRNFGLSLLSPAVEIVHFLDDDVTLHPGYLEVLTDALRGNPQLGGVGGIVYEDCCSSSPEAVSLMHRLFLLDGPPGKMLASGHAPSAQRYPPSGMPPEEPVSTAFLNGCSSYSRDVVEQVQFAPLEGHSLFEDLDLSYRVSQSHDLNVIPSAALTHHRSPRNRQSVAQYAQEMAVHRYWFVQRHNLSRVAFLWSVLGQLGARLISPKPTWAISLKGLLRGLVRVLRNDLPRP